MWKPAQTSNDVLMHSRGPWKKHKYIKVVNGEYVYPEEMGPYLRRRENIRNAEQQRRLENSPAQQEGRRRMMDARAEEARRRIEADRRNALNGRNLDAARNKAARKAGAKRIADENAERARRSARLRDQRNAEGRLSARKQIAEGNRDQLIKNAFRETARGIVRTAKEKDKQRLSRLRDQRNAEGRLSARKQIEAGNQRSRDEAARLRKLNAVNTTRKAQRQGMARTEQVKAAEAARKKEALIRERGIERTKQLKKQNAAAATERSLEAARNKAARKAGAKRIADENARRSQVKARAGAYRGATNSASNRALDNSRELSRLRKSKYTGNREFAKEQAYALAGDSKNERKARKKRIIADKVYTKGVMNTVASLNKGQSNGSWKMDDPRTRNKAKGKRPTRLDVAVKQAGNAISREAYRTGYKARKAASSAAKSISAAAREAWNTASSYKDKFADFESFYKWYKKNVRK